MQIFDWADHYRHLFCRGYLVKAQGVMQYRQQGTSLPLNSCRCGMNEHADAWKGMLFEQRVLSGTWGVVLSTDSSCILVYLKSSVCAGT